MFDITIEVFLKSETMLPVDFDIWKTLAVKFQEHCRQNKSNFSKRQNF